MKSVTDLMLQPFSFVWISVESILTAFWWPIKTLFTFIRIRRFAMKFPVGEKTWPLLGHVHHLISLNGPERVRFCINMGTMNVAAVLWVGVVPFFYVWDPEDVQRVLCNSKSQDKPYVYGFFERAIGKGLITSSGNLWHRHHKAIAPTFHAKILDSFVSIFNSQVDVYVHVLRRNADGNAFDILHGTERLTIDIICETAMGINLRVQEDSANKYVKALTTVQECVLQRVVCPWLHPEWLYALSSVCHREEAAQRITRAIRDRVIRERKKSIQDGKLTFTGNGIKQRLAFLDHILLSIEAGTQLSDQEIADEVDTFMLAGTDTTSLLISYTLFEVARYPNVQDKVVEELESLYDASLPTIDISPDDLNRMTYLEMVLKETLRLHPPVPVIARHAGEDIRLATSDLVIPAGALVGVPLRFTHRCADYYSDPDRFDPERFSPEKSTDRHPFAFLPFSAGQRVCIGRRLAMQEAKTAVAKALWHYKFFPEPGFEPADTWGLTMKPVNGLWLKMQARR